MKTQQKPSVATATDEGLGTKKTLFVIATVIGCIAILWPKVFYPMMFSPGPPKPVTFDKGFKPGGSGKCCEVILDKDTFLNTTSEIYGPKLFRKKLNLLTGEKSLRQERPPHLRTEGIHPAMRERGRAIPNPQTVPIVDRPRSATNPPPRIVEGRPGPIPGMRPPMGAGSVHQAQPKGSSMGFIMPLYTIGIVAFFLYTIMKLVFKKPTPNAPYGPVEPNSTFKKEVFGHEGKKDLIGPKLVVTAIQGLIVAADEQLKNCHENSTDLSKTANDQTNGNISNGHAKSNSNEDRVEILNDDTNSPKQQSHNLIKNEQEHHHHDRKKREGSSERSVTVVGMELTASCEGGHKWVRPRPPTPDFFFSHHDQHSSDAKDRPEPHSIYLEGTLPHESQILVTDSETYTENLIDSELNGTEEEPAVVLSSKMTLSLINLNNTENSDNEESNSDDDIQDNEAESPLNEDDMEIISNEEDKVSLSALMIFMLFFVQGYLMLPNFGDYF